MCTLCAYVLGGGWDTFCICRISLIRCCGAPFARLVVWAGLCAGNDKALAPMFNAIKRIHKRLDKVTSVMSYLDVRFERTEESTYRHLPPPLLSPAL